MNIVEFNSKAEVVKKKNQAFLKKLKLKPPKNLDELFHDLHDEVFEQINCLTCANCCKTTSPIFYQQDIERAAKAIRVKPGDFIQKYLYMDEDGDFVLHRSPCAFLEKDNTCKIYADRPKACREYPHTNRKKMRQILELTFRNTMVCPAVLEIVERVKKKLDL